MSIRLYYENKGELLGVRTQRVNEEYMNSPPDDYFGSSITGLNIEIEYAEADFSTAGSYLINQGAFGSGGTFIAVYTLSDSTLALRITDDAFVNVTGSFASPGFLKTSGTIKLVENSGSIECYFDDVLISSIDFSTIGTLNTLQASDLLFSCRELTSGLQYLAPENIVYKKIIINAIKWDFQEGSGSQTTSDQGTITDLNTLATIAGMWAVVPDYWVELDVDQNDTIRVSKQLLDYKDPSKRKSDFSKDFSLPFTDTNNAFFNIFYDPTFEGATFSPYKKLEVLLYEGNDLIIKGPMQLLYVDRERPFYKVRIFGALNTIKNVLGKTLLKDLDWSEFNHEFSGTNITKSWNGLLDLEDGSTTDEILYPLSDWGKGYGYNGLDITNISNPVSANDFYPALKIKTIIEGIFTKNNLVLDLSEFTYPDFDKIFYQLFVEKEKSIGARDFYFFSDLDSGIGSELTAFQLQPDTDIVNFKASSNGSGVFDDNQNAFIVPPSGAGNYDLSYSITCDWVKQGPASSNFIRSRFLKNGAVLGITDTVLVPSAIGIQSGTAVTSGSISSTPLLAGDIIQVEIEADTIDADQFDVSTVQPSEFKLDSSPTVFVGGILNLSKTMGEITQIDVVKSFLNQWNLVLDQDPDIQENYKILPYDTWIENGEEKDLSELVDVNKAVIVKPATDYMSSNIDYQLNKTNDDLNKRYLDTNGYPYGAVHLDTGVAYSNGSQKLFSIFAPYPTSRVTDANMFIARYYKDQEKPSLEKIKPQLFFYNGKVPTSSNWFLDNLQGGVSSIPEYPNCSNFRLNGSNQVDRTSQDLNFAFNYPFDSEFYIVEPTDLTIYKQYHQKYNNRLYDNGNRIIECYFYLTSKEYTSLKMNDKIILNLSGSAGKYLILNINEYPVNGSDSVKMILMKL